MADKKCCENCYYGQIWSKAEKRGDSCCVVCILRSDPFKCKVVFHSKEDKCRDWRTEKDEN